MLLFVVFLSIVFDLRGRNCDTVRTRKKTERGTYENLPVLPLIPVVKYISFMSNVVSDLLTIIY